MKKLPPAQAFEHAKNSLLSGKFAAAEMIGRQLVEHYPDNLDYQELLIETLCWQNKMDEARSAFKALLLHVHPTEDAVYDAIYVDGLQATHNPPVPFKRHLRFYELTKQLQATTGIAGEVAECGCFRGLSSFLICSYLRLEQSTFDGTGYHIFDSFQGLAAPTVNDDVPDDFKNAKNLKRMSREGMFAAPLNEVKSNLSVFPGIQYYPGWIPDAFDDLPERSYRFIHIDVDHYDPTRDCLEYFYPRLAPGGALVSDDYSWPGARKAIDEFCAERDLQPLITGYQQAVLSKPLVK